MSLSISRKFVLLGIATAAASFSVILVSSIWKGGQIRDRMEVALVEDAHDDLKDVVSVMLEKANLADEILKGKTIGTLGAARELLDKEGAISLATETSEWKALNQVTKKVDTVQLPLLMTGEQSVITSDIPDFIARATGDTATIFQRMNDAGDMLRVCTSVRTKDGKKAVGTYIPSSSPVVQTVLSGETFVGRAFVVDQYYLSAYEPIRDGTGKIVGMLYAGAPDVTATQSLKDSIERLDLGDSGRVRIFHTKAKDAGSVVLDTVGGGSNSDVTVREFLAKGEQLEGLSVTSYSTQEAGSDQEVVLGFYKPWDWLIVASVSRGEMLAAVDSLSE